MFAARFLLISTLLAATVQAEPVAPIAPGPAWGRFTILMWQYKTDAQRDLPLYRRLGLRGFHIDRGAGQEKRVGMARDENLTYYVDHAAGKGVLHMHRKEDQAALHHGFDPVPRPASLADPAVIQSLKKELSQNLSAVKQGPALAYAFDDEISTGIFNSPIEVDASPIAVTAYRKHLQARWSSIKALNTAWQTTYQSFDDIGPASYESVRLQIQVPLSRLRLAPWMSWRAFNDKLFADALAELTRHANTIDPRTPAGFVGGQNPSAYGGYDYDRLSQAVQWMEAYDIGGTNEILRSLWHDPARPHVQTFFSTGEPKRDAWFLWYYLLHGNRGVIAWPDRHGTPWFKDGAIAPFIEANADTFKEVQGPVSEALLHPEARFETDGIAVFLSQDSIRVNWAIDATAHGKTWPRRSSSLDNACQIAAKNRVAWFKLLEDLGYQYNVVTGRQITEGALKNEKVLILNRAIALSDDEVNAIADFVAQGGTVIADHLCGLTDERGVGRRAGALDDLFGLTRDESAGYFNGKGILEINGERFGKPYVERFDAYEGALRHRGIPVVERGTRAASGATSLAQVDSAAVGITRKHTQGRTLYLNLSPAFYWDTVQRAGTFGAAWRDLIGDALQQAGLKPVIQVTHENQPIPMTEVIRWRRGNRLIVGIIRNPTRQGTITGLGEISGVNDEPIDLTLRSSHPVKNVINLRTGDALPEGRSLSMPWNPWEAMLIEMDAP